MTAAEAVLEALEALREVRLSILRVAASRLRPEAIQPDSRTGHREPAPGDSR